MKTLYVHVPFCLRKCFYCSFDVVVHHEQKMKEYVRTVANEIRLWEPCRLESIYWGGGTPSHLPADLICGLSEQIHNYFDIKEGAECTIEINPETVNDKNLSSWKHSGFNRLSLGIQTFSDKYLAYLGRNHDCRSALSAYNLLRKSGIDNISIDLMYGFPGQTTNDLLSDLKQLVSLKPEHISLYSLTIEKNSRFYAKGVQVDPELHAKYFVQVKEFLQDHHYDQYEISNFSISKKNSEHNMNYWRGGDYIGLGMGAHSHIQGRRSWNANRFSDYVKRIHEGKSPVIGSECLDQEKQFTERFLLGLRITAGVNLYLLEKSFSCSLNNEQRNYIEHFIEEGLMWKSKTMIGVTDRGQMGLDEICSRLMVI